ncbi:hypothetical protein B296_00003309 [Ensete ventricosum]|uniref:DUF834 domain-containing protein n=1 Tax=Ensete ventricosum TaxID=4639 RepID=A0A427AZ95_ENSVE|nr:hypothetical protein B296_00003309 [Ensete ventricosum]
MPTALALAEVVWEEDGGKGGVAMSSLVEAQGKDSGSRSCNCGKGLEMVAMSRGRRGVGVGDSRKTYDGESRVGRNVISVGGAGELQRQLATSDEEEGRNSGGR